MLELYCIQLCVQTQPSLPVYRSPDIEGCAFYYQGVRVNFLIGPLLIYIISKGAFLISLHLVKIFFNIQSTSEIRDPPGPA